ncbi:MAG TPA: glycoside hydrolase family 3 C-terminal domain-containing protein [Acidobacteriota bacterium]|nr:glycoside hydrolase family 3 C-terminal domain-containing protein [Acidobacteriota bacterium]
MAKLLKWIGWTVVAFVVLLSAAAAGFIGYVLWSPAPPIHPASYSWKSGMPDEEVDLLARELLAQMTLDEKVDQMTGDGMARAAVSYLVHGHLGIVYSGYNERLGIPPVAFTDGPRGIVTGRATSFPVAMARAAGWDPELEEEVGEVFGKEARAVGANYFGGVCINLLRHPSWGRAQETYGEDPWLVGVMGSAVVRGVQKHNVMACAKHFALNSIENSRFQVNVVVDERALREVYLPHFRRIVEEGAASIMSAYNRVRGEYCGHNRYLLTDILREDWGFRGFVSSDWIWGLRDPVKGVWAGLDLEMPGDTHYRRIPELVRRGFLGEEEVDAAVFRILRTKLRFLTRTDPQDYPQDLVAAAEHRTLARRVAEESVVLLKNEADVLPLDGSEIRSLALMGRLIDEDNTGDRGSSYVNPPYLISPLAGFREYLGPTVEILAEKGDDLEAVRRAARKADVVVVVTGFRYDDEGEYLHADGGMPRNESEKQAPFGIKGGDRYPLGLKPGDIAVIRAAVSENPRTVVVLVGGGAVTMEEWKQEVPAVLTAWYFGMEGGRALPRVLFGDVNPSGKLPVTIPVDETQLPPFDPYAQEVEYDYYHGYTLVDKRGEEPAFPFGFGMSYTKFAYSDLQVLTPEITAAGELRVQVKVANTGPRAGKEVVQMYVGFENSRVDRPIRLLRDFHKIDLAPGESMPVELSVSAADLAWYNPEKMRWEIEPMEYSVWVGGSSRTRDLRRASFRIVE